IRAAAYGSADGDPHVWCCDGRHRVPAAVAGDPGAVRGDRPGLRADPADIQLRDADPGSASVARSRGRGDDGVDVCRGPAGLAAGPVRQDGGVKVACLARGVPFLLIGVVAWGLRSLRDLERAPEFAADSAP